MSKLENLMEFIEMEALEGLSKEQINAVLSKQNKKIIQLELELQEAKESITEIYNIIHDMLDDDTSSKLPKELYKWAGKYPFHKWVIESEAGNE